MPKVALPVGVYDLKNLRASGLTDDTIRANRLYSKNGDLYFPYRDLTGEINCFTRWRMYYADAEGKRYRQPPGSELHAYYPVASLPLILNPDVPLYITEGEKKALALSQLGVAAVGITGIWSGCKPDTEELIEGLAAIPLARRVVYIVFDFDPKEATQRQGQLARARLARAFARHEIAAAYALELPPGPDDSKQGIDDFLAAGGEFKDISIITIIPGRVYASPNSDNCDNFIPPILGKAAYHGPMGDFTLAVAPHTEATDPAILLHLLCVSGAYIGPGPRTYAGGTKQQARVNGLLVGPSAIGRKGTAEEIVSDLWQMVDAKFTKDQKIGGLSTGEGLIKKLADEQFVAVEKRVYVVEPEFSRVLAVSRRDFSTITQVIREIFDHGNLAVLTRNNPLKARGAHGSIIGHITPPELYDRFNHIDLCDGLGNRFLWFAVISHKIKTDSKKIPEKTFTDFAPAFQKVNNLSEREIPMAPACKGQWDEIYRQSLRPQRPGWVGELTARGSAIVPRLALIYYLLDCPIKGGSQGIKPIHLEAAMAVWDYCRESVEILWGDRQPGASLADKILKLLPITKDELNNHLSPNEKKKVSATLAELMAAKTIRRVEVKGERGRPAVRYERI
jgi:hypothetical protein